VSSGWNRRTIKKSLQGGAYRSSTKGLAGRHIKTVAAEADVSRNHEIGFWGGAPSATIAALQVSAGFELDPHGRCRLMVHTRGNTVPWLRYGHKYCGYPQALFAVGGE